MRASVTGTAPGGPAGVSSHTRLANAGNSGAELHRSQRRPVRAADGHGRGFGWGGRLASAA
jgi:hypothetical protein